MSANRGFIVDIGQGLSIITGLPTLVAWKTADRPKRPARGTIGFNSETNSLEFFSGSEWFTAKLSEL